MLEAVLTQLKRPEDYTILRRAVREGATEGLTPDAVCRFHLALKGAILDTLRGDLEESIERNEVIDKTGAMLDEMLIRFAQFTHDKRHDEVRALERGQRKVLGFDQDRLQPHLDTMNEGFTSVDNLETITTFNGEMERMTGHSRNEMVGRHVFVLYPPESVSVIRNQLSRRRRGESSTYTTHINHKDGRLIPVRVSGAPLHDQENRNIGSFAVITDISDQVLAETKLRKNNEYAAPVFSWTLR
jgi:PAS domain S-box-containing protein